MIYCPRCLYPPTGYTVPRYLSGPPVVGDIYRVWESIETPIISLLGFRKNSTRSTAQFIDCISHRGKVRPCVVVDLFERKGRESIGICAMGTLNGADISELPFIYRHFLVPINPNGYCNSTHVHTASDWNCRKSQWLLAIEYTTDGHLDSRWEGHNYIAPYFSRNTMKQIREICCRKMKQWQEMCEADPGSLRSGDANTCNTTNNDL